MKKILFVLIYFFSINISSAWHDTEVSNEDIAILGGVWVQIYVYEQHCTDNQYYSTIIERLEASPRFKKYSSEIDHFTEEQELAWERGGAGAGAVISSGATDCDSMATIIWEWFGEN